jgi:hypothetical protein
MMFDILVGNLLYPNHLQPGQPTISTRKEGIQEQGVLNRFFIHHGECACRDGSAIGINGRVSSH